MKPTIHVTILFRENETNFSKTVDPKFIIYFSTCIARVSLYFSRCIATGFMPWHVHFVFDEYIWNKSREIIWNIIWTSRNESKIQQHELVSGCPCRIQIIPVLEQLHWLPIRQRIAFKRCLLVFKPLKGLAPQYITVAELLQSCCCCSHIRRGAISGQLRAEINVSCMQFHKLATACQQISETLVFQWTF